MVSRDQRVQICVCLAFILCLRLTGCRFFDGHLILVNIFKVPIHLMDDMMKALLDMAEGRAPHGVLCAVFHIVC